MSEDFILNVEPREGQGKGASRRLRRAGRVPVVVYGGGTPAETFTVNHNELIKHFQTEAFYSHVLTLKGAGAEQSAVLKAVQRHPAKAQYLHLDLMRVVAGQKMRVLVPIHVKGEHDAPGVKRGGGVMEHHLTQVEVEVEPKDLPEYLEADASQLELDGVIHLSQIRLPAGVTIPELDKGNDPSVVAIHVPPEEPVEEGAPADTAADTTQAPKK